MDHSTPGLPVPHHLLAFAQVHIHHISFILSHIHNNLECVIRKAGRKSFIGNYLAIQWLGLRAFTVLVQSLVRELNHF